MPKSTRAIDREKPIPIVTFTPDTRHYVPSTAELFEGQVHHTDIEIPLGHSRYGGPVIDLPQSVQHPEGLRFAAQLDLSKFAPFDKSGLLPKTGHLLFFADIMKDEGTVIYADVASSSLVRTVVEHEDNFYSGVLIEEAQSDLDLWAGRFNDEGEWDFFAGSDRSKLFGIPTHCQWGQHQIEDVLLSGKTVLLQVGENGFNDEGVFSVLIDEGALERRDFSQCEFLWGQS